MRSLVLAAAICGAFTVPTTAATFTGFVGFSDSFNDEGRILSGLNFPSFGNRFSDGPVWFEQVGDRFENRGLTDINLSLGGATAGEQFDDPLDPTDTIDLYKVFDASPLAAFSEFPLQELQDFDSQIDTYLSLGADVGDHPLYAISLGGNDILQRGFIEGPVQALSALVSGIGRLVTEDNPGGQKTILVANFLDPAISPELPPILPSALEAEINALSDLVQAINIGLSATLGSISVPNVTIEVFDMFSVFNGIVDEAETAGLKTSGFCIPSFTSTLEPRPSQCLDGSPPSTFLFGDTVHPLSFAHDRLAAATIAQLDDRLPPIPLPSGLPLMAGALGLLLVARRLKATGLST